MGSLVEDQISDPNISAHSSPLRRSTKNETPLLPLSFPACVHYICSGRGRKYFGCCPYKDATCCKDQTHCCPHGLTCDVKAGRCLGDSYNLLLAQMVPRGQKSLNRINKSATRRQEAPVKLRKTCTDPLYSCDDSQTCCPLDEGGFGCCPLGGDAVCCPDKENCCPHGYVCDPSGGTCSPRPGRF